MDEKEKEVVEEFEEVVLEADTNEELSNGKGNEEE